MRQNIQIRALEAPQYNFPFGNFDSKDGTTFLVARRDGRLSHGRYEACEDNRCH